MILSIVSPKGTFTKKEVDYVVVQGNNGQLAILEHHIPIVVPINQGFVKEVCNNIEHFYVLSGAILEFKDSTINVITQEIAEGNTLPIAKQNLEEIRKTQKQDNKQKLMDFTEMEKELALNLKQIKASKL